MTLLILFSFQPDLLNFKKGWMSRLGEDGKVILRFECMYLNDVSLFVHDLLMCEVV